MGGEAGGAEKRKTVTVEPRSLICRGFEVRRGGQAMKEAPIGTGVRGIPLAATHQQVGTEGSPGGPSWKRGRLGRKRIEPVK